MTFFNNSSVLVKIVLLATALAAVFLGVSIGYVIIDTQNNITNLSLRATRNEIIADQDRMRLILNGVTNDFASLENVPPIQGMLRAEEGNGIDLVGDSTLIQWKERLGAIFASQVNASNLYYQLRFIDSSGEELVRVNNVEGKAMIVKEENLQNKKDRGYFIEAIKMRKGEIYISEIDLNREGSPPMIEEPHNPVVRIAVPIFLEGSSDIKGIIIANVFFDEIVSMSSFQEDYLSELYVVDENGYYIVHPDNSKEWGGPGDLDTGENYEKDFSDIISKFGEEDTGAFIEGESIFSFAGVSIGELDSNRKILLIRKINSRELLAPVYISSRNGILVGFLTFVILFFAFVFVIKRILSPLDRLKKASEEIGKGNFDQKIEVNSRDEIGILASTIDTMSKKLSEMYEGLEGQVNEKTKEIQNKIKDLEEAKLAMLNVMEDLRSEREGLKRANTKLEKFDRLKDEFLSIASHELRTPMTAIKGIVSMMIEGDYGKVNKDLKDPLSDVFSSTDRLIHLVNDMLNVSRIEAGRLRFDISDFNINDIVKETHKILSVIAKEKKIKLEVGDIPSVSVQGDAEKVGEILNNLVGNSLKFTDKGGIKIYGREEKGMLKVFVEDSGIGINDENQKTIFDKFRQVNTAQIGKPSGSGLGLYIAREITRKMGGELWIEKSEIGKGSTFAFSLPLPKSDLAKKVKRAINIESEKHPDQKTN